MIKYINLTYVVRKSGSNKELKIPYALNYYHVVEILNSFNYNILPYSYSVPPTILLSPLHHCQEVFRFETLKLFKLRDFVIL